MAKKLEECTRQFKKIQDDLLECFDALKQVDAAFNHSNGIMTQAAVDIGDRVQELVSTGNASAKLDDNVVKNDAQVKAAIKAIDDSIAAYGNFLNQALGCQAKAAKAHQAFETLKTELETEVKQRTGKKVAFFKIESKSLPELQKLLADMGKYEHDGKGVLDNTEERDFTTLDSEADLEKKSNDQILSELSQTRAASVAGDAEMLKAGLDLRLLKGVFNKVKIGHDAVMTEARNLIEARKSSDAAAATAALQKARQAFQAIDPLAAKLITAMQNSQVKAKLISPQGVQTKKAVDAILTLHSDAGGVLKKLG